MNDQLDPYLSVIRSFVVKRISADEFENRYLALFKSESQWFAENVVFTILDGLFADVDAYVADPALRDEPDDLDETQLRACAAKALSLFHPAVRVASSRSCRT